MLMLISRFFSSRRCKTIITASLLGLLLFSLLIPIFASAQTDEKACAWYDLFCYGEKLLNSSIQKIIQLFIFLIALLFSFFATLLQFLIQASANLVSSDFVNTGFRTTLGVANLGFVLAIIAIAFTTILRLEKYAMKQLLWKLIVAAVLINFSLAIAGAIIDFTNVFSYFFIERVAPNGEWWKFSEAIANGLRIQAFSEVDNVPYGGSILDFGTALFSNIASLIFAFIFGALSLIVFVGITLTLLIRYIYLSFLLILMPLAWLFWVIPQLDSYWQKWWTTFLRWTFYLPAVTFFLMIAVVSFQGVDKLINDANLVSAPSTEGIEKYLAQDIGVEGFLQVLIKLGLLTGALFAGNALGIAGAKGTLTFAKSAGKEFVGGKSAIQYGKDFGKKVAQGTAKIPVLRRLLPTPTVRSEMKKVEAERIEKKAKKIEKDVRMGKTSIEAVQGKTSRWKNLVPYAKRGKSAALLALANLEKDGVYPTQFSEGGIRINIPASPKLSKRAQKQKQKIDNWKKGGSKKSKEEKLTEAAKTILKETGGDSEEKDESDKKDDK